LVKLFAFVEQKAMYMYVLLICFILIHFRYYSFYWEGETLSTKEGNSLEAEITEGIPAAPLKEVESLIFT